MAAATSTSFVVGQIFFIVTDDLQPGGVQLVSGVLALTLDAILEGGTFAQIEDDPTKFMANGASVTPIPEPGTLVLVAGTLAGLAAARRRR